MAKGVLIALGIMVVCFLIPLAHFVLAPASPFIGGYFGISRVGSHEGSAAAKSLIFGCLLGSVVLLILAAIAVIITMVAEDRRVVLVAWGGAAVLTLYTASMSGLGAMFYQVRQGPVEPNSPQQEPA